MKNRYTKNRIGLSILILVSMLTASLLSSGIALADDSTPQVDPQSEAVATATPTLTPTATLEQVSVQQDGGADAGGETPTAEPTQTSDDVSSNASTEATDTPDPAAQPSDTPELSFTETPTLTPEGELTPTATEEAELVVPLLMPEDTSNIIPGQYIVVYKNNKVSSQGLKSQRDKVKAKGGKIKVEFNNGNMKGFAAQMDKDTLKTLRQDKDIAYIEPDQYIYAVDETVGDQSIQDLPSSTPGLWGLDRIDQAVLTRDYLYHYPTSAGAGVHVYVLDSGIRASHIEFGGRVSGGYDFVDDDPYPDDEYGHGTKVAGVIGASTYGVAKSVYLHSVRVLDNTGDGSFSDVVAGINWVIDNHSSPAVINMSLGAKSTSTSINTAVANAVAAGITVVVSAGNTEGGGDNACGWTPASAASALTIGATTSTDARASYSNYGSCLDLFAPGSSILTTTYTSDSSTGTDSGTSIASPFVAGAAALYLADHPSASPAQVASAITSQATSNVVINPGTDSPNLLLAVFSSDVPQVTLASPADGSRTNQTDVTLSWNAGYIGNSYNLEVDDSDAFDSLFHTFSTEDLSDTVSGLTEGTWYWRVQASNTYGTTGAWSETWSFTVDLTPPSAPAQSSPANGANVVGTPTFSWSTVADAAAYRFEYSASDDSGSPVYLSDEITETSFTPPDMDEEVQYYWYVQARDEAGNWSDWSAAYTVMVVPPGPNGPTLTSPTYGALVNTDIPELTWTAVSGAVAYQVELSSTYAFDTVLESSGDLTELTYTAGPLDDAKYYWRVRSKSNYGIYGSWSAVRNFTVDTSKPVAPELISPVSGAQSAGMPIFSWGSVVDAEAYQFEYGLVDNGEEYIYRSDVLSTTSIQPPGKNTNVPYYWFARARDAAGNWSDWSSSNSITVLSNTPAQVALDSPANKTLTNDKTPQFSWVLLDNSEYYHLQIADSKYFTNIVFDQDAITGQTYTLLSDLGPDGVYYWRVRGRNGSDDYGAWSGARYFTLDTTAPDAPLLLSPVDNSTYAGQPTYKWSRPSTSKYYRFKYTTLGDPDTEVYLSDDLRSYKFKAPAIAEGIYYWYAQAGDAAGNWSDWSAPFTITIVPPTPSRLSLSTPTKGSLINAAENPPTLAWNTVDYAETFDLQVSTSSRFSTLAVDQTGITETTYALSTLFSAMDDGKYYWRVRARNSNDVYGSWSSAWYFTVDNTPPAAPTLYTPTNGAEVIGTPTFKWLRPDTAKYFIFQYNTIDDTDTYVYQSDLTSRNTHQPDAMVIDTPYYWFVKAQDRAGNWSDWSEPYTVTVRAPLPGKPVLSAPAKASYVKSPTPELSWNAVDYGLTYDVQVSASSRFTTIQSEASGQTELTFTTTNLPDGKYYWRVRATNDTGTGSWSSAYYFVVDTLDPAVPVLRSPIDISTVVGSPTFKWYSASGAKYYRLAYNTADDPETALYTSDWVSSTSMKITSMDFLTQYYWFVQSKDKAGNISDWSAGNTVIVLPPNPGRVTTTSPGNGTLTDDTELNLAWNAVLYGHTYEYQIDDSSRFNSVDYSGSTSEVGATSIITDTLETGRWYWHVRAVNENSTAGPWSSTRYITIYPKFNSTFETDADFEDWTAAAGASWSVASGSLSTAGMAGGYSTSANFSAADFGDFTYEADMRMDAPASGESNTYGLVLRGTPSFDAWNDWTSGVYFTVRQVNDSLTSTQYACALAYKITSGRWYYLGGSCAEAVYGDLNNLKVYAKGRTMKFYVNDYLILSKTVSGLSGTKLGVVSWGESVTGASVDAAVAGAPVQPVAATASSLSAQTVTMPEGVTPKDVFNQMKK